MRPSVIAALLLPFTTAGIVRRGSDDIVNAILDISANIDIVNTTLDTFKENSFEGIQTVLKIQGQTSTLLKSVQNATAITKNSTVLDTEGSIDVAAQVFILLPDIQSLLDNLVAHKPAFDSVFFHLASASPQVKKDLEAEQLAAHELGEAIHDKLIGIYQSYSPIIIGEINDTFAAAIGNFSNAGGRLPFPPIFPPRA